MRRRSVLKGTNPQSDSIRVICRFRPPYENQENVSSIVCNPENNSVEAGEYYMDKKVFTFDKIFWIDSKQNDLFEEAGNVIDSVLNGFNGTILACKVINFYLCIFA